MYRADILTIGQYICFLINVEENDEFYTKIGEDFIEYVKPKNVYYFMKELLIKGNVKLIGFLLHKIKVDIFISKPIRLQNDGATCNVTIYKNVSYFPKGRQPLFIKEFLKSCDTFILLDNLISMKDSYGKILINDIVSEYECPILLKAGYLHYGDYIYKEENNILERLFEYYSSIGFNVVEKQAEAIIMVREVNINE